MDSVTILRYDHYCSLHYEVAVRLAVRVVKRCGEQLTYLPLHETVGHLVKRSILTSRRDRYTS